MGEAMEKLWSTVERLSAVLAVFFTYLQTYAKQQVCEHTNKKRGMLPTGKCCWFCVDCKLRKEIDPVEWSKMA